MIQTTKSKKDSLSALFGYWLPELISLLLLVVLPLSLDSFLIGTLKSTAIYGVLGSASRLLHFIFKLAEAVPVASVALIGRFNGAQAYEECGKRLSDALWTSLISGIGLGSIFFFGAYHIYEFLGVPPEMIPYGMTFLKVQAINIPLVFLFSASLGFMKALKNTQTPLLINTVGVVIFVAADYGLIHGAWGLPALGLTGSAFASLIRYLIMNLLALVAIRSMRHFSDYFPHGMKFPFNLHEMLRLVNLSWPVVIDKGTLAFAYMWLGKLIATCGTLSLAALEVIKNVERYSLLPALAFAQVVTFLVSNSLGAQDLSNAKLQIRRVIAVTIPLVLLGIMVYSHYISFFSDKIDPSGELTLFVKPLLRFLSIFLTFDLLQILLAASLRGAGDVKMVMLTRAISVLGFLPLSYLVSKLELSHMSVKFGMIYSSYYFMVAFMAITFFLRLRSEKWHQRDL